MNHTITLFGADDVETTVADVELAGCTVLRARAYPAERKIIVEVATRDLSAARLRNRLQDAGLKPDWVTIRERR